MRVLFVGDVVGRTGRRIVRERMPSLRARYGVDIVVANAENAAGGFGLTPETADELWKAGCDVLTLGNHTWDKREVIPLLETSDRVVRPSNWPGRPPGRGWTVVTAGGVRVVVVNLLGRVFLPIYPDCPFRAADALIPALRELTPIILVDFHAEATSEKQALSWYLDGRVSAVLGTHTHVQTADARVLPGGTAAITDVGMTGPADSVIGVDREVIVRRFLSQLPARLEAAEGRAVLSAVLLDIDAGTGRAVGIERIYWVEGEEEPRAR